MAMSTLTFSGFFCEIFLVQLMTHTDFEKKKMAAVTISGNSKWQNKKRID
jgi:hypothetical protein